MTTPTTSQRHPTIRKLSTLSDDGQVEHDTKQRVMKMVERANCGDTMTDEEVSIICDGIANLVPIDASINFEELRDVVQKVAHLSHKDWSRTSRNSDALSRSLSISSDDDGSDDVISKHARQLLERILLEGNWDGAKAHSTFAGQGKGEKPWAVLVTGVNGIRKTTSMYQPWFEELLSEALSPPAGVSVEGNLPTGRNSFFRQLDHIIATLMNEEFFKLYAWASSQMINRDSDIPLAETVQEYSDYKAAIFSRYRTLSELMGAILLKQAQKVNLNCLMETSGKDVAMFHYIDHFFDSTRYNKLALHFVINDLSQAKESVDKRMIKEIQAGSSAVQSEDAFKVVYANAGGPYGSKVLESVQTDSEKVWQEEVLTGSVGEDWYKATIAIEAHPTEPWTAQAVKSDGTRGTKYTFEGPTR
ncbi:unnamed protein product [Cylindrotheca closterium]|uniref:Uncharacterized protein n=1 Tax=Cylindrotheca closterium TaxID=2856 RepID=A0AAD2JI48_9STRA|nr:unnamed protein product [Cylindrotheca closterium]